MKSIRHASAAVLGMLALLAFGEPAMAQKKVVIRAVPIGNLKVLDPIWTTAYLTRNHAYMVWDTLFSLDADNISGAEIFPVAQDASSLDADILEAKAELAAKSKPRHADKPATPAARPAFGSASSASMPALSDSNGAAKHDPRKRPPVKITLVKPGEKSPFAK